VLAASQVTPGQDDRLIRQAELGRQQAEVNKQVEELATALREDRASRKSIQISSADSDVWKDFQRSADFQLQCVKDLFDSTKHRERVVSPFKWDEREERKHSESYVSYVKGLLDLGQKWSVIDANPEKNLLDNYLCGRKYKGTTDVAVIEKDAGIVPAAALKIVFELKKDASKINSKALCQTIFSLLLANAACKRLRPVAMLTDLVDQWILVWVDPKTIFYHRFGSRGKAVGFLTLNQMRWTTVMILLH
jgi:hypothetical protein